MEEFFGFFATLIDKNTLPTSQQKSTKLPRELRANSVITKRSCEEKPRERRWKIVSFHSSIRQNATRELERSQRTKSRENLSENVVVCGRENFRHPEIEIPCRKIYTNTSKAGTY